MKTPFKLLLAAALALPLLLQAAPPLLYSQYAPVTVANTADYTPISSGPVLGSRALDYAGLARGQVVRMRATGTISTAPGGQFLAALVDLSGPRFLSNGFVPIAGGLSRAPFAIDVTLTVSDVWPQVWFGAYGDCTLTVNGTARSLPPGGKVLANVPMFFLPSWDLNWLVAWGSASPANSLTVNTLVVEVLK